MTEDRNIQSEKGSGEGSGSSALRLTDNQKTWIVVGIIALSITLGVFSKAPQLAFTGQIWTIGLDASPTGRFSLLGEILGRGFVPFLLGYFLALIFRRVGERAFYIAWSVLAFSIGILGVLGAAGFSFADDSDALLLAEYAVLPVGEDCRNETSDRVSFDAKAAREAGYLDPAIAQSLAESMGLRLSMALEDGWTYNEIVREVAPQWGKYCAYAKSIGN
uniref:hypothetical protein n=1 Tax=uncultured Altererythrobacter sp. TaxID=500840 RepID=UPI002637E614|nr:hypothetical protein [uncultured Altererythrobacter sp.]